MIIAADIFSTSGWTFLHFEICFALASVIRHIPDCFLIDYHISLSFFSSAWFLSVCISKIQCFSPSLHIALDGIVCPELQEATSCDSRVDSSSREDCGPPRPLTSLCTFTVYVIFLYLSFHGSSSDSADLQLNLFCSCFIWSSSFHRFSK